MDTPKQDCKEEYSDKDYYSDKSWDDKSWDDMRPNMCCPYMNYSPNMCCCPYIMQGMYMNPSMMYQQPMIGREYDDQFDDEPGDEDMSRRRHHHHYYYYYYPPYMYGHMYHKPRPRPY